MDDHTYKHIRLTGSSQVSSDDAVNNAISKASETVNNINWFKVLETRGYVDNDAVQYWQVTVELGFRLGE